MAEESSSRSYGSVNSGSGARSDDHYSEDLLRRKLKYFFLNPCEKWRAKKKFPWKLLLQMIKIVLVTIQLTMFGISRSAHVEFLERSSIAFKHLFLKDWSSDLETLPYPPSTGAFAVYTHDDFYRSINFAMEQYELTEDIAVGTYQFARPNTSLDIPPMELCNSHYRLGNNWSHNQSYHFDARQQTTCLPVHPIWRLNNKTGNMEKVYDIKEYLMEQNKSINFDGLNIGVLSFNLTAIHLKYLSRLNTPDCYIFNVKIQYDNSEHNGQMLVNLDTLATSKQCFGEVNYSDLASASSAVIFSSVFDSVVILVSVLSGILCARSLVRGHQLKLRTVKFFRVHLHKELTIHDKLEFLNMWYLLIIINDILTVMGSGYKIGIENKLSRNYEACGILLGTGSLLVWFGVLRYLGFFQKYNILILTMKKSAPNILRFLVCAGVFYFGFTVCGWVVLGPYHIKFKTISASSECLFSLVNGDDMFVTFASIGRHTQHYIWVFSRIYLYTFISLFIYMVLNIFLTVIMDAYDTLKFRKLHSASECLFSLVNGDDMFVTFAAIRDNSHVWWYSRVYLYTFISLFIYVILSVFISVIMDTYETIKSYNEHGFPKTTLEEFIDECTDEAHTLFRSYSTDKFGRMQGQNCPLCICGCLPLPCCHGTNSDDGGGEYTSLIS